ncbi:Uncharacterised protein g11334 [Pycnogonum litorale]
MGSVRRFLVLLKKNFLLRKRHYIITALEVIVPLLVFLPMLWLGFNSSYDSESSKVQPPATYPKYTATSDFANYNHLSSTFILFAPNDDKTKKLMNNVHDNILSFLQKHFHSKCKFFLLNFDA